MVEFIEDGPKKEEFEPLNEDMATFLLDSNFAEGSLIAKRVNRDIISKLLKGIKPEMDKSSGSAKFWCKAEGCDAKVK